MTSEKLDSLSLEALYAVADKMGLDLPPGLERLFVVEEISEAIAEDSEDRRAAHGEAVHVEEKKYSSPELGEIDADLDSSGAEAPVLETRYNETMIHALVRDPSWAFAYWDLSDADQTALFGEDGGSALFLRVVELGGEDGRREYFDIPVSSEDHQWYINLPRPGVRFRIDLCVRPGDSPVARIRVLARSNDVESPRQSLEPDRPLSERVIRLLELSGIQELNIELARDENPQRILPARSGQGEGE
ncbi:MAG TPA: DUF4912 domain-containing protein [Rectinemataceae bacterium]|nr:DUF4912 domain-containing protein [Rectinemataceae bacterium]